MSKRRFLIPAIVLTAAAAIASCRDASPVAPTSAVAAATQGADLLDLSGLLKNTGLISCNKMPAAWASATIDQRGGTITVGPHSFVVPKNALNGPVTITAYAPSSNINSVQFSPAGLQFDRSASLTMSYANCNLLGSLLPKHIAYIDAKQNILYLLLSVDDLLNRRVTGQVDHFSEYAVAW